MVNTASPLGAGGGDDRAVRVDHVDGRAGRFVGVIDEGVDLIAGCQFGWPGRALRRAGRRRMRQHFLIAERQARGGEPPVFLVQHCAAPGFLRFPGVAEQAVQAFAGLLVTGDQRASVSSGDQYALGIETGLGLTQESVFIETQESDRGQGDDQDDDVDAQQYGSQGWWFHRSRVVVGGSAGPPGQWSRCVVVIPAWIIGRPRGFFRVRPEKIMKPFGCSACRPEKTWRLKGRAGGKGWRLIGVRQSMVQAIDSGEQSGHCTVCFAG